MYTTIELSPSEIGFTHPLSEELVAQATRYIQDDLISVLRDYDDSETRQYDKRRTHAPLSESSWLVKYKKNKVLITNQISDESSKQFNALYYGNGDGMICARHGMTRQRLKGWGGKWIESKKRYSEKDGHKDKPHPFELGKPRPGVMKYYDKRTGMWMYRQCVHPISSAIVFDVQRSIRAAVLSGLERAYIDTYDWMDKDTLGANEPDDPGLAEPISMEEMHFWEESRTKVEKDTMDYIQQKNDEIELTKDSRLSDMKIQERARSELQKVGLVPGRKPIEKLKPRGINTETKTWWGKMKKTTYEISDSVSDRIHRFFGV